MKKAKAFKAAAALTLAAMLTVLCSFSAFADSIIAVDSGKIFNDWVSYPDKSFGSAYDAEWVYNSEEDYINTTANVGWTGFYNPDITNFTTGEFSFDMLSENFDPSGFTWGMQKSGTDESHVYSFYAYEECEYSRKWSVAYIESWTPADSPRSHQGPVYHSTIDAKDGEYSGHSGNTGTVGFAKGTVLAYGDLPSAVYEETHNVTINVSESSVNVKVNGEDLTTVEAAVQSGSFGPYACSNPDAYFSKLSFTSSDVTMINAQFDYVDADNKSVTEVPLNSKVSVADQSTYEGSPIADRLWTVTKDGEQIYSGSTPYTEYTKEAGKYVTTLQVVNEQGVKSSVFSKELIVTAEPATTAAPATGATSKVATPDTTPETTVVSNKTIATSDISFAAALLAVLTGASIFVIAVYKKKANK